MTAPRLVIFDLDGTIVDSQHEILAAMAYAFGKAGQPAPSREEVLSIVGLSLPQAMAALAPHLPEEETEALADHYRQSFLAARADGRELAPLYPGAIEAIETLAGDPWTLLGIATGKARRGLDHVFSVHPIGRHFATLQTADLHPSKPHPAMIEAALRETGCAPERAVMIGDTEFDMAMGRAAGVATIAVTWGYHPRARLAEAGPSRIVDRYEDLPAAVAEVWSEKE